MTPKQSKSADTLESIVNDARNAIKEGRASRDVRKWEVKESKQEAIRYMKAEQKPFRLNNAVFAKIVDYYQLCGADKMLPSDGATLDGFIMRFHREFAIKNPFFPMEIPFLFVYQDFADKVVQGFIEIDGMNIKAQVKAFREYMQRYGNTMRRRYYDQHPDREPTLLQKTNERGLDEKIAGAKKTVATMLRIDWNNKKEVGDQIERLERLLEEKYPLPKR